MKTKILALSVSMLVFSFSGAQAVEGGSDDTFFYYADAYAELDWDSLDVTGNITSSSYLSESQAGTGAFWYTGTFPDESTWVTDSASGSYVTSAYSSYPVPGDAYTAADSTGKTGATDPVVAAGIFTGSTVRLLPGDAGAYSAWARAGIGQSYLVAADGPVTFSIPYDILFDTIGSTSSAEYVEAMAWGRLYWSNGGAWNEIEYKSVANGYGDLTFNYTATAGTYLLLNAGTDTIASIINPVPIPPSVLMLLTGCTSLFFLNRRKS